jgi:hypothetical protein
MITLPGGVMRRYLEKSTFGVYLAERGCHAIPFLTRHSLARQCSRTKKVWNRRLFGWLSSSLRREGVWPVQTPYDYPPRAFQALQVGDCVRSPAHYIAAKVASVNPGADKEERRFHRPAQQFNGAVQVNGKRESLFWRVLAVVVVKILVVMAFVLMISQQAR